MENEIIEILNRQICQLNQLIALVNDLTKKKTIEQDWYDTCDTLRILKISERTLYRLRNNHPDQCRRIMGKWYYNLSVLLMFENGKVFTT